MTTHGCTMFNSHFLSQHANTAYIIRDVEGATSEEGLEE